MRKITFILATLVLGISAYAQAPAIESLEIAGRALKGTDEFGNSKPFTKVSDGVFEYYGYFYNVNPEKPTKDQGFKIRVNLHVGASTEWNNNPYSSLVPSENGTLISHGNNYAAIYSDIQPDNKWRLIVGGDNWYKITVHTSDLTNVNFDFNIAAGTFANLGSLKVAEENAVLTPAFDPAVTVYNCTLANGTTTATPVVGAYFNTPVSGGVPVDVSAGSGVSTIVVTSLDGTTTKTYTVNYLVNGGSSSVDAVKTEATYSIQNRKLYVKGTDNYTVYGINGVKVANVKDNMSNTSIELAAGAYIVKTNNAGVFKVLVK